MLLNELTYCKRAASPYPDVTDAGDATMWRSASYDDGSPVVASWSTNHAVVMLLDSATPCPWLICHDRRGGWNAIAPVPYVGSLASVLSGLVER